MNIARIKEVSFYVGLTEDAQACFDMKKFLDSQGISYKLLAYWDDQAHEGNFKAMSTWTWGEKGEQREFTRYPVLTWQVFDEDFNSHLEYATNIAEVKNKLLPHAALIKL
jgi:hypothetical protein